MDDLTVSVGGLHSLIRSLDKRKVGGPDHLSAYLHVEFALNTRYFTPCLAKIMNASLFQSRVPSNWKNAFVVPIHKGGKRDIPGNYRLVSLTSRCSNY